MGGARERQEQGDFGEAWLHVIAAGSNLLHGTPTTLDLEKADVELVLRGEVDGTYYPTVKVQVKTTASLRQADSGAYSYDLDVRTYDVLRRENHSVSRLLAVIEVDWNGERFRLHDEGTLLLGRGAWTSLAGLPATSNTETQAVTLPMTNTLDRVGLETMLKTYGSRRTTFVPDINIWEEM